jgi:hypothetical protein
VSDPDPGKQYRVNIKRNTKRKATGIVPYVTINNGTQQSISVDLNYEFGYKLYNIDAGKSQSYNLETGLSSSTEEIIGLSTLGVAAAIVTGGAAAAYFAPEATAAIIGAETTGAFAGLASVLDLTAGTAYELLPTTGENYGVELIEEISGD